MPFGHRYLSFNAINYYIKSERLMKLNKNAYKNIYFILIDFYLKLYIGLLFMCLNIF